MNIYRITHSYCISPKYDVHINTNLLLGDLTDILIGIGFIAESLNEYNSIETSDLCKLLCDFFDCEITIKPKFRCPSIDLYTEREKRCGDCYDEYISLLKYRLGDDKFNILKNRVCLIME